MYIYSVGRFCSLHKTCIMIHMCLPQECSLFIYLLNSECSLLVLGWMRVYNVNSLLGKLFSTFLSYNSWNTGEFLAGPDGFLLPYCYV